MLFRTILRRTITLDVLKSNSAILGQDYKKGRTITLDVLK